MTSKRTEDLRKAATEPALRIIMRRLREIMAEASDGQTRLDKIVRQIAVAAQPARKSAQRRDNVYQLRPKT